MIDTTPGCYAVEDENGVVTIYNADGSVAAFMNRKTFDAFVENMPRADYAAWIKKNTILYCASTPCPKCGTDSPCCDHVEVDIGVGTQTGEHQYHCIHHGAFGFSYATGEPIFQDAESVTPG